MKKQTWQQWARLCAADPSSPSLLKKGALAALTGTDIRVLDAFVPCLQLYAHTGDEHVLGAAQIILDEMQPHTLWIAKELIPFVLDWNDREKLWPFMSLERGKKT